MTTESLRKSLKESRIFPINDIHLIVLLIINTTLYALVFLVRTQQAFVAKGAQVDLYPVSKFMRGIPLGLSADQLRLTSYGILGLICLIYLIVIVGSSLLDRDVDQNREKRLFNIWVVLPYALLGTTTIFLFPHVSTPLDTVDYTVHARIQTIYAENPYAVTGAKIPDEALTNFMEAKSRTSVYGPVWQYISLLPAWVGAGGLVSSIIAFKVLFWGVGLLALFLIRQYHSDPAVHSYKQLIPSAVMVAWNPLIHLVSHGDGHNDILMAIFLAGMIAALAQRKPILGFGTYALSVLVKYISAPLLLPMTIFIYRSEENKSRPEKIKLIATGVVLIGFLMIVAAAPFGISAMLTGLSGKLGGLVSSEGTSKITILANLLFGLTTRLGLSIPLNLLSSLVSLALPITWILYIFLRSLSVKTLNDCVKIILESFLFFITFVALPAYAQYVITPVLMVGFLYSGFWHRAAVVVASLAFLWDQFFIVHMPDTPIIWETYLHQISHLTVIFMVLFFIFSRLLRSTSELLKRKSERLEL